MAAKKTKVKTQDKETQWGRPNVFEEQAAFNLRLLSSDLVKKIDGKIKGTGMSRRVYLEHLLRTHPELQENQQNTTK